MDRYEQVKKFIKEIGQIYEEKEWCIGTGIKHSEKLDDFVMILRADKDYTGDLYIPESGYFTVNIKDKPVRVWIEVEYRSIPKAYSTKEEKEEWTKE